MYRIINTCDQHIDVYYKTASEEITRQVESGETVDLFVLFRKDPGPDGPYVHDVDLDIIDFKVTRADSLVSSRNFRSNETWSYDNGTFTSVVTNAEF
ncbi:MAG: hypothetical protein R2852_03955 [Bacteroidia bacterium]